MKKILFFSCIFFLSCGNENNVSIPKEEYNKLKGIKPLEYPISFPIFDNWNNPTMCVVKADNCEYIAYSLGANVGTFSHKGNCKFCQQRLEITIRKIIQEELKHK